MNALLKIIGRGTRLEDVADIQSKQRFTENYYHLDTDYYIDVRGSYFCIGIFLFGNIVFYVIVDENSKYLSCCPAELFSDKEFVIPKSWGLIIDPAVGPQLVHPKLTGHKSWWSLYHDDDPEVLAIVDEIIQEIQAEEEAKNPKKDPFDEYWGL